MERPCWYERNVIITYSGFSKLIIRLTTCISTSMLLMTIIIFINSWFVFYWLVCWRVQKRMVSYRLACVICAWKLLMQFLLSNMFPWLIVMNFSNSKALFLEKMIVDSCIPKNKSYRFVSFLSFDCNRFVKTKVWKLLTNSSTMLLVAVTLVVKTCFIVGYVVLGHSNVLFSFASNPEDNRSCQMGSHFTTDARS